MASPEDRGSRRCLPSREGRLEGTYDDRSERWPGRVRGTACNVSAAAGIQGHGALAAGFPVRGAVLSRDRWVLFFSLSTLALGIAATVTALAVTKSVLLDPLPFDEPDRLVMVERSPRATSERTSAYNYSRWASAPSRWRASAPWQVPMNVSGFNRRTRWTGWP